MNLLAYINHVFHHQSRTYPLVILSSVSRPRFNTSNMQHTTNNTLSPHYRLALPKPHQAKLGYRPLGGLNMPSCAPRSKDFPDSPIASLQ